MKIYHNQLQRTMTQGFTPVWLVFGDEPWQKNNSLLRIKQYAKQQGFDEVIRFSTDNSFDWQQLVDEYQSLSLFANQRIIEVELTSVKVGDAGNKALLALAERLQSDIEQGHSPQDIIFIFYGEKVDAAGANRKWFKLLTKLGCYLPLYDIELKHMPTWLQNQAKEKNVTLTPELTSLLIEMFEGNLLALDQELEKLALLFGSQAISIEQAEPLILKQAKFNPFQITDALLQGDCKKCITMLDQLQQEGTAATQIIWVLHKEISQLYKMLKQIEQGESIANIYKQYRIWDKRKPIYQKALSTISLANVKRTISRIADADLVSKTSSEFNSFILLADICVTLHHGEKTASYQLNYG